VVNTQKIFGAQMDTIDEMMYLAGVISEETIQEAKNDIKHYMFFSNLHTIKEKVDKLLSMDQKRIDKMLDDGHDWAAEHVATSKDDLEEVYNWISSSFRN
jgi:hypothetical protein